MPDNSGGLSALQALAIQASPEISIWPFAPYLLGTGVLCWLLGLVYEHRATSLSNRDRFARNFVVVGMTTMTIITIVKASLALSLGLVGALSIVRFRTAIKEPEELGYLFLVIGIGLGFGAGQWLVTCIAFCMIAAAIWLRGRATGGGSGATAPEHANLFLTVSGEGSELPTMETMTSALTEVCAGLDLKRFDRMTDRIEASYVIRVRDLSQLQRATEALEALGSLHITFVEQDGTL